MESKKVFEFTYAEYPAMEPFKGLFMVLVSFIPHMIPLVVISRYLTLKCNHHLFFFLGLVASHELAKILKKIIKQPRPVGAPLSSYGMPSDHSQFVAFTTMYLVHVLITRPGLRKSALFVSAVLMCTMSIAVFYSRVYLNAHTTEQVVVGAILGVVTGSLWYQMTQKLFLKWTSVTKFFDRLYDVVYDLFLGSDRRKTKYR